MVEQPALSISTRGVSWPTTAQGSLLGVVHCKRPIPRSRSAAPLRVPLEIEEGAADLRSVIGTGRAYRHRGAVPERLCEDIARVLHASPSRPDDPCPTFCR